MDTNAFPKHKDRAMLAGFVTALLVTCGVQAALPTVAHANTVATINVTQGTPTNSGTSYHSEIVGVASNLNGSEPATVTGSHEGNWKVLLPDYYEILDPVVEPYRSIYNPDGSRAVRGMYGFYAYKVTTFAGNEIVLTLHKTHDLGSDSFQCEIEGITWYNGTDLIDVSHLWDGEHRESSVWFYFDEDGNFVTL